MRVLLTSNASYSPPRGGSTRSNLVWLAHLVNSGHECEVVCPTLDSTVPDTETVDVSGIRIVSVRDLSRRTAVLADRIRSMAPDWVLVSSEDVAHVLLREAHEAAPDRIVYLAHTPQFFPFGPASWHPDPQAARLLARASGVIVIGRHMAAYVESHLGRRAAVVHPPMYGEPPFPRFGSFNRGWMLMINPCVVKGISIFLALADRFPDYEFAGLAGWGTTARDRDEMARRPNIRILETVPKIDDALVESRLLLMPSLWYEGFGLIAMEAMLRGLPVISSDSGGLVEAKEGTRYVIPVRPIERFDPVFDEAHMPKPVEVQQDIEPWVGALRTLMMERAEYEAESKRSREAALRFVSELKASDFEAALARMRHVGAEDPPAPARPRLDQLSPAKRALLLQRLRERL
jgi:glycosyltransferase involved in cell wall biosynthesis